MKIFRIEEFGRMEPPNPGTCFRQDHSNERAKGKMLRHSIDCARWCWISLVKGYKMGDSKNT